MQIIFSDEADEELAKMDAKLREFFVRHAEKASNMPPGRHMQHGVPYNVEEVTSQARMIYEIAGDALFIVHCFATHKEYEKWYKSFY